MNVSTKKKPWCPATRTTLLKSFCGSRAASFAAAAAAAASAAAAAEVGALRRRSSAS